MSSKRVKRCRSVQACFPEAKSASSGANEHHSNTSFFIEEIRIDMPPLLPPLPPPLLVSAQLTDISMSTLRRRFIHVDRARASAMPTFPRPFRQFDSATAMPTLNRQFDSASAMPTLPSSYIIQFDSASAMPTLTTPFRQVDSATAMPTLPGPIIQAEAESTTNLTTYVPLYQAALTGDWNKAKEFISSHQHALAARITKGGETALHIAAGAKQTKFVEDLVKLMKPEDLALQNKANNTALCFAAASGITSIAEIMVKKNENLPTLRGSNEVTALHMAALLGYRDMVRFLYSVTDDKDLTKEDYIELLLATISSDLYDVALDILLPRKELAIERDSNGETALHVLARKHSAFSGTSQLGVWQRRIHMQTPDASGNARSLSKYHNHKNSKMQRELLWFKEVEKNVLPLYREMKNTEGQTPRMLFTQEHKKLVEEGEKWMKDTATSCMLVATLITTVMFAAIFTVPGGNTNEGTPIFLKKKSFIIFSISDAFALFSSVTSILMFLSILTSRYAENDFLDSLPNRLIIGLTTLFFSIASMLIAFSATFFVLLGNQLAWIVIPVALTAVIPVTLFAFLQFPLLADMMHSTYGSGIFGRQSKDMIYLFDNEYHPCH